MKVAEITIRQMSEDLGVRYGRAYCALRFLGIKPNGKLGSCNLYTEDDFKKVGKRCREIEGCHTKNEIQKDIYAPAALRDKMMSVTQVAEILGLSKRTVYRLFRSKQMPQPVRIGGSIRWKSVEIEDWLDNK